MRIRNRWLQAFALAIALAAATPVRAVDKASLRLNWLYYGFHSFFPLGVDKGYYRRRASTSPSARARARAARCRSSAPSRTPSACRTAPA